MRRSWRCSDQKMVLQYSQPDRVIPRIALNRAGGDKGSRTYLCFCGGDRSSEATVAVGEPAVPPEAKVSVSTLGMGIGVVGVPVVMAEDENGVLSVEVDVDVGIGISEVVSDDWVVVEDMVTTDGVGILLLDDIADELSIMLVEGEMIIVDVRLAMMELVAVVASVVVVGAGVGAGTAAFAFILPLCQYPYPSL